MNYNNSYIFVIRNYKTDNHKLNNYFICNLIINQKFDIDFNFDEYVIKQLLDIRYKTLVLIFKIKLLFSFFKNIYYYITITYYNY